MESRVPGCIPGVFPLIRHGVDILVMEIFPSVIAPLMSDSGGSRSSWIAGQPSVNFKMIILFGPQHPGPGLSLDITEFLLIMTVQGIIKNIRFSFPLLKNPVVFRSQGIIQTAVHCQPEFN